MATIIFGSPEALAQLAADAEVLVRFRTRRAELQAERVCDAAQIDTRLIRTEGLAPANLWHSIVRHAHFTARLIRLIEAALEDYPDEAALAQMLRELRGPFHYKGDS